MQGSSFAQQCRKEVSSCAQARRAEVRMVTNVENSFMDLLEQCDDLAMRLKIRTMINLEL